MFTTAEYFSRMFECLGNRNINAALFTTNHLFNFSGTLNVGTWRGSRIPEWAFAMLKILANDKNTGTAPQFGNHGNDDQSNNQQPHPSHFQSPQQNRSFNETALTLFTAMIILLFIFIMKVKSH